MPAVQTANPPSFESVWAALQETDRIIKENQKENAVQMKELRESQKEDAVKMKEFRESQKETDKQIKEIGKRFGDFTNSFGSVVEYMIAPNLQDRFFDLGLDFQQASNDVKIHYKKNNIAFQIDVFLENGDTAMLVEVKADLTISDINTHIERLEKMRKYADLRNDKRKFLGAVAGVVIKPKVKEYAFNNGLYLVEPAGETFNITPPPNKPKEWN